MGLEIEREKEIRMKQFMGMLLLNVGLVAGSHAAEISWTTNGITGAESDVLTNGILIEAINGAATGESSTPTVNGVPFVSDGSLLANNYSGDTWAPVATNDYDTLLSTIDYEASGTEAYTIKTFQGLTVGGEYMVQVWYAASDMARTMTYAGSGDNVLDGTTYGVGTFTADATTQDLIVTASQSGPRLTAYQFRAISGHEEPDPIIEVNVTNLVFGETYVGYTNSMTLSVKNVGGYVLDGTASVSAPFFIASGDTYSLSNGVSQVVTVWFAPQSVGEVTNSIVFTGGDGETVTVSGTGATEPEPSLGLSVSNLTFATTYVGSTNSLTVTVMNEGGKTLSGMASVSAPFYIESGADYSLGLGEEQDVVILFSPVTDGEHSETLSFTGAGGSNITVSGTGKLIIGTVIADVAGDYTGPSSEPEGWDYLYSDAAVNGTEVALTPDQPVASAYEGGNTGFGDPLGENGIAGVLGSITGDGLQYEIFSDGYDGNTKSEGNGGVPGIDLLMHPGKTDSNAYVIVRYTFTAADLAGSTLVNITGSFREEVGKTVSPANDSIIAEIYHNDSNLFSVTGADGRLWQADGTFDITDVEVAVGDTISFIVGNNGVATGDETALTGKIVVQSIDAPEIIAGPDVVDGNLEFQFTGVVGLRYQVELTEGLTGQDWKIVQDFNPLTTTPMDVSVPATNSSAFYRIKYVD
jgi:hypothetical protein